MRAGYVGTSVKADPTPISSKPTMLVSRELEITKATKFHKGIEYICSHQL
jgi:hypothetical protein